MAPVYKTPGAYVEETAAGVKMIVDAPTGNTAFIGSALNGPYCRALRLDSFAEYERSFGALSESSELGPAVSQFFNNGGVVLWVVRMSVESVPTLEEWAQALAALDEIDLLNLLALPGVTDAAVLKLAHDHAVTRRSILLIDPPASAATAAEVLAFRLSLPVEIATNAAFYSPWIKRADSVQSDGIRLNAPSGTVAGVIARLDGQHGFWKAPAGIGADIKGITDLAARVTHDENEQLNSEAVNCLRQFPTGPVIWGARMLAGRDNLASEWKYISVRRMALFLEESLVRGLKWATLESNDDCLWAQIRVMVGDFLRDLFRRGAFQGSTAQKAYFVKCDGETNTVADMSQGSCNVSIGFAPLRPAEFILITVRLSRLTE